MAIINSTIDKSKAAQVRWAVAVFEPDLPADAEDVTLKGRAMRPNSTLTTATLNWPDDQGINRPILEIPVEANEDITLADIAEFDTLLDALGGLTGFKLGKVTVYARDPRDAAGKFRYKLGPFDCSMRKPDGEIAFGGNDYSLASVVFKNLSGTALTWVPNADAPSA